MKFILFLRHAKSSWNHPGLSDFDRPLANRGLRDAPSMGKFLHGAGYSPQVVVSSPARRARQTTELFTDAAGLNKEAVIWKESLYYGSSGDYLDTVRQSSDQHECLLMVGHNPLIEEAVSSLCCEEGRSVVIMPTAALVCLEYPGSRWSGIQPGTARLKWMMIPKALKKPDDW